MVTPTPAPARPSPLAEIALVFKTEPALVTNLAGTAAALIAAFGVNVTQVQEAAIVTIASALITIVTAFTAKPVKVSVITGAVVTGLTAAAAFGLKLSPDSLAMVTSALGYLIPGLLLRMHLVPNVALRRAVRGEGHPTQV